MYNLNQKITLKGLTSNIPILLKSNYKTIVVDKSSVKALRKFGVGAAEYLLGNLLQIPNEFDVVSFNDGLFVHKHKIGAFFTYRISDNKDNPFSLNTRIDSTNVYLTIKNPFPIPKKVLEHFSKLMPCGNFDFINCSGQIWRRDNSTMQIEWHKKAPQCIAP